MDLLSRGKKWVRVRILQVKISKRKIKRKGNWVEVEEDEGLEKISKGVVERSERKRGEKIDSAQ